jgi:uncharacterized membrane protein
MAIRARLLIVTAAATAGCLALLAARVLASGDTRHAYLAWNLVLAWIPMLVAVRLAEPSRSTAMRVGLAALWLGFLPNAPYLVTDIVHLPHRDAPFFWADLTLLAGVAGTGLLLGSASLYLVHDAIRRRRGELVGWLVVAGTLPLVGIGVALGRFARRNSWDPLLAPHVVGGDVLAWAAQPGAHAPALRAAALLAGLTAVAYLVLYGLLFDRRRAEVVEAPRR